MKLSRLTAFVLGKSIAAALVAALALAPLPASAAQRARAGEAPGPAPATTTAAPVDETDAADLTTLREKAAADVASNPTAQNQRRMAELAERSGDYETAATYYDAELKKLDAGDAQGRARATADLQRVREKARGVIADEGASTNRAVLDAKWTPAKPPDAKPTVRPQPTTKVAGDDRIVKKWYFWVTLGAIAGAAAAVTAIAIKASRDDKPDALDRMGRLPTSGLRF
jgi:hypothetical protein